MSPEIIAVDEIGRNEEFMIIEQMHCSGVKILGTIHAGSFAELQRNPMLKSAIKSKAIERFVGLEKRSDGTRKISIYNGQGECLWENC